MSAQPQHAPAPPPAAAPAPAVDAFLASGMDDSDGIPFEEGPGPRP